MNLEELLSTIEREKRKDKTYADSAPNPGLFMGEWVRDVDAARRSWDRISKRFEETKDV